MAPKEAEIISALKKTVSHIFHSAQRDDLTVKLVRNTVEADLSLGDGFLQTGKWKAKGKEAVQAEVVSISQLGWGIQLIAYS